MRIYALNGSAHSRQPSNANRREILQNSRLMGGIYKRRIIRPSLFTTSFLCDNEIFWRSCRGGVAGFYLETHSVLTAHSVNLLMGSPNYSNKGVLACARSLERVSLFTWYLSPCWDLGKRATGCQLKRGGKGMKRSEGKRYIHRISFQWKDVCLSTQIHLHTKYGAEPVGALLSSMGGRLSISD